MTKWPTNSDTLFCTLRASYVPIGGREGGGGDEGVVRVRGQNGRPIFRYSILYSVVEYFHFRHNRVQRWFWRMTTSPR